MGQTGLADIPVDVLRRLVREVTEAKSVDWSARDGAVCPVCGTRRCRVTSTTAWSGKVRERYHRCQCCTHRFKSVEEAPSLT